MAAYAVPARLASPRVSQLYQTAVAIAPADNTAIGPYLALYVGTTGDVTLVPRNTTAPITFKNVEAGTLLQIAFQGVNLTGTSAVDLVGLA